jgi:glycosyltransferase involved in cell wall biosynthesis
MINAPHILYLSYDGLTDALGQSQILPYIIGLSKRGYRFSVVSFEKEERFESLRGDIENLCKVNNIAWHPLPYTKTPPVISTLKDVRKMHQTALTIFREDAFQIVHCRSYLSALVGSSLQKKQGVKFLFDMRGFWADERVEGKIWNLKNPIYRWIYSYFKRKEKQFFQNSNHIVSLTHNGKSTIVELMKDQDIAGKITVIPCCVDTDLFDPNRIDQHQLKALRNVLKIDEFDFVLGYVGSIGTWYMLEEMMQFFNSFLLKIPTAKFMFVTNEPASLIKECAIEQNVPLDKLVYTSTIHKHVPLHIALFDCSIFFIRPTFSKRASSPTKQGEIMAMGKPVICNAGVGDTDEIVRNYNSGVVIDQLDKKSFEQVTLNKFDAHLLRSGAIAYFGLESGINRYEQIYSSLLDRFKE